MSQDDETNNVAVAPTTVHVLRSNLTVHGSGPDQGGWASNQIGVSGQFSGSENNVDFAARVGVGHTLDVTYVIENNSFGDAVQPWQNTVYLSRDLILDGGDLTLGSDSEQSNLDGTTNAASPTQSAAFVDHFVIPANTSPGTWYVIVKADSNDQVSEQPCFTLSTFCPSADGNGDNTVHATTTVHVLRDRGAQRCTAVRPDHGRLGPPTRSGSAASSAAAKTTSTSPASVSATRSTSPT